MQNISKGACMTNFTWLVLQLDKRFFFFKKQNIYLWIILAIKKKYMTKDWIIVSIRNMGTTLTAGQELFALIHLINK